MGKIKVFVFVIFLFSCCSAHIRRKCCKENLYMIGETFGANIESKINGYDGLLNKMIHTSDTQRSPIFHLLKKLILGLLRTINIRGKNPFICVKYATCYAWHSPYNLQ